MRQRNPTPLADGFEPDLVRGVVGKMIGVALDRQAGGFQNLGESLAEIAIGEIDKVQAARS